MLQVARLAPNELHDASERVVEYLRGQFNADGGVKDRDGNSDLYYTVFGLEALSAMRADLPNGATASYLDGFAGGQGLDLVHLACLARCRASLRPGEIDPATRTALLSNLERFRAVDGGFSPRTGSAQGTVYHSFLALGAHQDLGADVANPDGLIECLTGLQTPDGGYANEHGLEVGTTPAAAAAVTLLRNLGAPVPASAAQWLLGQAIPDGGFLAMPRAPMPDLLSTATALHALAGMQVSFEGVVDGCLDFVDTLWTGRSFCGNWSDDSADVEYTYYGLLALGHLSL